MKIDVMGMRDGCLAFSDVEVGQTFTHAGSFYIKGQDDVDLRYYPVNDAVCSTSGQYD